ncbi:MAG: apolipoprotein N-acyltransferase [Spirochaetaceae bacterium]|jgi:apolipoprotein N-acyltransferase|nr:apolipoprotein N-acyltransferase [Spirochaetaceae bacterium]
MKQNFPKLRLFFVHLLLVLLGALLFAASFPNILSADGFPFLAWIAFVPVFYLIHSTSPLSSVFWGALYGYAAYGFFNYWLSVFHPLAGIIVDSIYLVYFAALFPLLKLAGILFPRRGYLVQWAVWIAYEYLRTLGFLGYSYGIAGYSQWSVLPLIQIADIFGVWGVSALVVFPSAALAAALRPVSATALPAAGVKAPAGGPGKPGRGGAALFVAGIPARLGAFFRRERVACCLWLAALAGTLVYGALSPADYRDAPSVRLALIQHNTDPWKGGIAQYRRNYEVLKRLSLEALGETPKPDLVVWSETAFVPRIYWHTTYRDDPPSWELIRELLDFLKQQDVPFLIGNDDARKEPPKNPEDSYRVDYNAVMLFERGEEAALYRKLHLVPFTEHFPYGKQFPWVYNALKNADTHFWENGAEATVFESAGVKFSTPICFEDTFGYLPRLFTRNGAELIVNLSNDAWSASLPAQMQHLSMAVFRAVENRRSMARSTASGQTCGIDPNGKILAMAEPFAEASLNVDLPIVKKTTLYTRFGDIWGQLFAVSALAILLIGIARCILGRRAGGKPASDGRAGVN